MPRKTREEKILARLHRLEQAKTAPLEVAKPQDLPSTPKQSAGRIALTDTQAPKPFPSVRQGHVDYSYVKSDLIKTVLITFGALVIQIILKTTILKN